MISAVEYQSKLRDQIAVLSSEYDDAMHQYRSKSEIEAYTYLTLDTTRDDYVSPAVFKEQAESIKQQLGELEARLRDPSLVELMGDLVYALPPSFLVTPTTRGRAVPISWLAGGDTCHIVEQPIPNRRYEIQFKRYVLNGQSVLLSTNDDLNIVYRVVQPHADGDGGAS